MICLSDIFEGVELESGSALQLDRRGAEEVTGISNDSRSVSPGGVFFAIPGTSVDASRFIDKALSRGAVAIVLGSGVLDITALPALQVRATEPIFLRVPDVRRALALAANNYYARPTEDLLNFGVTGTNGKTSTCWLLTEALACLGERCVQLGTLGARVLTPELVGQEPQFLELNNTTPDPLTLFKFVAEAKRNAHATALAMEVSSHALVQERATGIEWNVAVFTNLTRDHLDFHGTMEAYQAAKLRLFTECLARSSRTLRAAVINADDPFAETISERCRELTLPVVSFSTVPGSSADVCLVKAKPQPHRTELVVKVFSEEVCFNSRLIGDYNISNMLTALAALVAADLPLDPIVAALSAVPPVPGRLELVKESPIGVFVDYAHTPDALVRAQRSLREITTGRLITVFGCGGERDRGKRPLMAKAVAEISDLGLVTSDNPRTESPESIVSEILTGLTEHRREFHYLVEIDRRAAIARAIELAVPGDAVLVAGKGHETYQEINGVKHPFSDREIALQLLSRI